MKLKFWQHSKFLPDFSRIVFRVSFITFLILFIIEYLEPGFVTNWFNPVWLLIIGIISATIITISY